MGKVRPDSRRVRYVVKKRKADPESAERTELLSRFHGLLQQRQEELRTAYSGIKRSPGTDEDRKRRKARREAVKAEKAAKRNHHYVPRGTATALFKNRKKQIVVSGPAGTGKSRACLEKVNAMLLLNPGSRALVVRKTLASLTSTGLVTFREKVVPEALENGVLEFFGGSAEQPAQYRYANGSVMVIGGMDKPTKIMSSEYDVVYIQEATECNEDDWEMLLTRLRNYKISFQQLIADCNPDRPTHWLKKRADSNKTEMLFSTHKDNPVLYNEDGTLTQQGAEYIETLGNLTGVRKLRLMDGIWAAADGLVYSDFEQDIHLVNKFDIPQDWNRYWTIDFGYTNPFVCQFWAEDPDGRLFMYREVYYSKRTVSRHAETIAKLVMDDPKKLRDGEPWAGKWKEPRPRAVICDHDAEGRAVLEQELGISTQNAHKAVSEGIQKVQERLLKQKDGKARIFFVRDSLAERDPDLDQRRKPCSTIDEITGYVWDDKGKDAPLKVDDHGMDAMRYIVAEQDLGLRPRFRSFRAGL